MPYENANVPYDIPNNWVWLKHNDIFEISGGSQPPKSKFKSECQEGYIRLYQIRDYGKNPVPVYIPISTASKTTNKGDILLARYGASLGKVFWAEDGAYNVAMAKVIPMYACLNDSIDNNYLFYYYHSNLYRSVIFGNSRSAQSGFNKDDLNDLWFPLPPLSEQHRIVEKIRQLEPYLNDYNLTEEKLKILNNDFPNLLKKSILQEAVQGKLVPQDENDEPASVLLERIRAEKQKLVAEGKIKKDKHESVIFRRDNSHYEKLDGIERCIDDEIPFDIPNNWCWVRLGEIYQHNTGKALNSSNKDGTPLTYITTSNLYWNKFELGNLKKMLFTENEVEKCTVKNGDLLVCEGGDIGRTAIWTYEFPMRIQNHIHRLRPYINIHVKFYYFVLYLYKKSGFLAGKGIGIQGLSSKALHNILVPLPPLSEQHRIVEKIEQLLNVTNKL